MKLPSSSSEPRQPVERRQPPLRRFRSHRCFFLGSTILLFWLLAQWSIFWMAHVEIQTQEQGHFSPSTTTTTAAAAAAAALEDTTTTTTTFLIPNKRYNNDNNDAITRIPRVANETAQDVIHIVHTRFMQHQGNLTKLGIARFHQFLAFCLPTMVHQTSQNFFWMIKVDPAMTMESSESHQEVFQPLLKAIEAANQYTQRNNIYLVASNRNYNMGGDAGSWRDGHEWEELLVGDPPVVSTNHHQHSAARVFTGDTDRLERAYDARESLPVLETRLDADDGLHRKYLERVQRIAKRRFWGNETPIPKWLYWCIRTQIEWHSQYDPNSEIIGKRNHKNNNKPTHFGNPRLGYLGALKRNNYCITPGITVGYGVGLSNTSEVPRLPHTKLWSSLHDKYKLCHDPADRDRPKKGPCLEFMGGKGGETEEEKKGEEPLIFHALRSRSLTSTGMFGVHTTTASNTTTQLEEEEVPPKLSRTEALLWQVLVSDFAIDPEQVRRTQRYLLQHRKEIAHENSLGQCTPGHSCKDEAKKRLDAVAGGS